MFSLSSGWRRQLGALPERQGEPLDDRRPVRPGGWFDLSYSLSYSLANGLVLTLSDSLSDSLSYGLALTLSYSLSYSLANGFVLTPRAGPGSPSSAPFQHVCRIKSFYMLARAEMCWSSCAGGRCLFCSSQGPSKQRLLLGTDQLDKLLGPARHLTLGGLG